MSMSFSITEVASLLGMKRTAVVADVDWGAVPGMLSQTPMNKAASLDGVSPRVALRRAPRLFTERDLLVYMLALELSPVLATRALAGRMAEAAVEAYERGASQVEVPVIEGRVRLLIDVSWYVRKRDEVLKKTQKKYVE